MREEGCRHSQQAEGDQSPPGHRAPTKQQGQRNPAYEEPDTDDQGDDCGGRQRVERMRHALLDRHREPDDPGNDREVAERVDVTGGTSQPCRRLPCEGVLERPHHPSEVRPPQRTGGNDRDQGNPEEDGSGRLTAGGDARSDQRFTQCDDDKQTVALGEVPAVEAPLASPRPCRGENVEQRCDPEGKESIFGGDHDGHCNRYQPEAGHHRPAPHRR